MAVTQTLPAPAGISPELALQNGAAISAAIGSSVKSTQDGLTALSGGGQTGAVQLYVGYNRVAVAGIAADSVMMPQSSPGAQVWLQNSGANSVQVFANTSSSLPSAVQDTLNGTAGATGIAVAAGKLAILTCSTVGAWIGPVALA